MASWLMVSWYGARCLSIVAAGSLAAAPCHFNARRPKAHGDRTWRWPRFTGKVIEVMQLYVADLRDFYATPLGQVVRRLLGQRIRTRWRGRIPGTMIGLGFATPYLGAYRGEA